MKDLLQVTFSQNTVLDYIVVLSIFVAGILLLRVLQSVIVHRLKA